MLFSSKKEWRVFIKRSNTNITKIYLIYKHDFFFFFATRKENVDTITQIIFYLFKQIFIGENIA